MAGTTCMHPGRSLGAWFGEDFLGFLKKVCVKMWLYPQIAITNTTWGKSWTNVFRVYPMFRQTQLSGKCQARRRKKPLGVPKTSTWVGGSDFDNPLVTREVWIDWEAIASQKAEWPYWISFFLHIWRDREYSSQKMLESPILGKAWGKSLLFFLQIEEYFVPSKKTKHLCLCLPEFPLAIGNWKFPFRL